MAGPRGLASGTRHTRRIEWGCDPDVTTPVTGVTTMRASRKPSTRKRSLTFVLDGQRRTVDIGVPMAVERDGRPMVSLMDLWVATLLPGDIFDLSFRMVTGAASKADPACLLDGMLFARGFIDLGTRQVWWSDAAAGQLVGACPRVIVVSHPEQGRTLAASTALPARAAPRGPSLTDLCRLLPIAAMRYPAVQWRDAGRALSPR